MSKPVISVEHLTKQYELGVIGTGTLTRDLERWWARVRGQPDPYTRIGREDAFKRIGETILALDDVSFKVEQGEALGIIGKNGAGKSTLLKILSRVTAPTSGVVKVKGRIGSLLEVGTGFHPELTGRENVYLNGAILGMKKVEVARKFDEIVDFSGVEQFIDTPVKRYSSGMYVRLAFAVAAHLDPEILIVDEVLAVGDAEFQKKCLGKMGDVAGEGRTVLFVSHNMGAIQNLCSRTIVLIDGKIRIESNTQEAVIFYLNNSFSENSLIKRNNYNKNLRANYTDIEFNINNNANTPYAMVGHPLEIILSYNSKFISGKLDFVIGIYNYLGEKIVHLDSRFAKKDFILLPKDGKVSCLIPKVPLQSGRYSINLALYVNGILEDHLENAYVLNVQDGDFFGTGRMPKPNSDRFLIDHTWILKA